MRISLERLDGNGLTLDLGGDQRAHIVRAAGLRGVVEQGATLKLTDVAAERVELDVLRLVFGDVVVGATGETTFADLTLSLDQGAGRFALDLRAGEVATVALRVEVSGLVVSGKVTMAGVHLWQNDDAGGLAAARVTFDEIALEVPGTRVVARTFTATQVAMTWGSEGFTLVSSTVDAGVVEAEVAFGAPERAAASEQVPAPSEDDGTSFELDWTTLDGLSGKVDADVTLDLTVPVLGRRVATHHFRVPVEAGSLDFIALENDLSTLENQLLDFAVRDGALVLERGIPLLPTRGRGKPIVVWDLPRPADVALAEKQRVRLAVLPSARLAAEPDPSDEPSKSAVALRRLDVLLDARLALADAAPTRGPLRLHAFRGLTVTGDLHHDAEGAPRKGTLHVQIEALSGSLAGLAVGASRLDVAELSIAQAPVVEVAFADVRPARLSAGLEGLALRGLALRPPTT